jgi:hypothetical protein
MNSFIDRLPLVSATLFSLAVPREGQAIPLADEIGMEMGTHVNGL